MVVAWGELTREHVEHLVVLSRGDRLGEQRGPLVRGRARSEAPEPGGERGPASVGVGRGIVDPLREPRRSAHLVELPGEGQEPLHGGAVRGERQRGVELEAKGARVRPDQPGIGERSVQQGAAGLLHPVRFGVPCLRRLLERRDGAGSLVLPPANRGLARLAHRLEPGPRQPQPLQRQRAVELDRGKPRVERAGLIIGLERRLEVSTVHQGQTEVVEHRDVLGGSPEIAQRLRVLALHQRRRPERLPVALLLEPGQSLERRGCSGTALHDVGAVLARSGVARPPRGPARIERGEHRGQVSPGAIPPDGQHQRRGDCRSSHHPQPRRATGARRAGPPRRPEPALAPMPAPVGCARASSASADSCMRPCISCWQRAQTMRWRRNAAALVTASSPSTNGPSWSQWTGPPLWSSGVMSPPPPGRPGETP